MCDNKLKVFPNLLDENLEIKIYSCNQVRQLRDYWLQEFRRINKSDIVEKTRVDKSFEDYKKSIDDFLYKCKDGTQNLL